jgi:hypothetical protein
MKFSEFLSTPANSDVRVLHMIVDDLTMNGIVTMNDYKVATSSCLKAKTTELEGLKAKARALMYRVHANPPSSVGGRHNLLMNLIGVVAKVVMIEDKIGGDPSMITIIDITEAAATTGGLDDRFFTLH